MFSASLSVDDEVKSLGDALQAVLVSVKAKGSVLADAEAALPGLLAAAGEITNIGTDIKKPANQAYLIYILASAFEPA